MAYEPKTISSQIGSKRGCLLYGCPGSGKTITALSISQNFPDVLPAKEPTLLKDIYVLQFDPDGLLSALSLGLDVPGKDLSSCTSREKMNGAMIAAMKDIREGVGAGIIKAVIIDSITFLDTLIGGYIGKEFPMDERGNTDIRMFKVILKEHMDIAHSLRSLGVHVIVVCHATVKFNPSSNDEAKAQFELKKRATALPGQADIAPSITGQTGNFWKGYCCNVWPVIMRKTKGQPPKVTVLTDGGQGFEGKCRSIGLESEEPANLKKIFDKADAASVIKPVSK